MTRQLGVRGAFPDLRLSIEEQVAEGDRVVTRVTFRGTHRGEFAGVAPTGREVAFAGTAVDRLADGKVVEMWHTANVHLLMQQIGAGNVAAPVASTPPAGEGSA
jgi:predicted ester cyclase